MIYVMAADKTQKVEENTEEIIIIQRLINFFRLISNRNFKFC